MASDPSAAVDACLAIGGQAGAECAALGVGELGRSEPDRALSLCGEIEPGVWRDECGFLVAENSVAVDGAEAAASRCTAAGRFANSCLSHIWDTAASLALDRSGAVASAAAAYGGSLAWADGVMERDEALERHFWQVFFDAATTRGQLPYDLDRCRSLGAELFSPCLHTLPGCLARALNRADRVGVDVQRLCRPDTGDRLETVVFEATGIGYVSSSRLDDVARRFVLRRCAADPSRPDP